MSDCVMNSTLLRRLSVPVEGMTDAARSRILTAVLLVASPVAERHALHRAVRRNQFRIDVRVVNEAMAALRPADRVQMLGSAALLEAPLRTFERHFHAARAQAPRRRAMREGIAGALHARLNFWPEEADRYAAVIREMLADDDSVVVAQALPSIAKVSALGRDDLKRLVTTLDDPRTRLSALTALEEVLHRDATLLVHISEADWKAVERFRTSDDRWESRGAQRLLRLRPRSTARRGR